MQPASGAAPDPDDAGAPRGALASAAAAVAVGTLPVVAEWAWKVFLRPRQDWTEWHDPEAIHFYASLGILRGEAPSNIHTPSTVLQTLGAAIAAVTGTAPFDFGAFRVAGYCVALAGTLAALVLLLRRVLPGHGLAASLLLLWTCFLCPQTVNVTAVWGPEILVVALGALALAAADAAFRRPGLLPAAVAGAACGLACGQRFTFLPWIAALGVVLVVRPDGEGRRVARGAAAAAGAVAAFVVATAVAIPRYGDMFAWLTQLATRDGAYGSGDVVGAPAIADAVGVVRARIASSTAWHAWLAVVAAGAAIAAVRARRAGRRVPAVVVFAAVAIALHYVQSVRTPQLRYMVPTGLLAGVLAAWAAGEVPPGRFRRLAVGALVAAVGVLLARQIRRDAADHADVIASTDRAAAKAAREIERAAPGRAPVVLYGRPFPHPVVGLGYYATTAAERGAVLAANPRCAIFIGGAVHLPPGAADWDFAVIRPAEITKLPDTHGPVVAWLDGYVVVARR